ncbi:MAG: DUF1015 domain-containing protein, partial [Actinomycetia bacterium]|nr:DUF1015 domain-containing protein [Actinomycetes bacterium]
RDSTFVRYRIERRGRPPLVGTVGLIDMDESTLYPHEGVMPSAVAARRADIERAGAHLEPIILAAITAVEVDDVDGVMLRNVDYDDESHQIIDVAGMSGRFKSKEYVILDGHHRIAATRQHCEITGERPWILAMVVDTSAPGLFVEPQHRVLGGPPLEIEKLAVSQDVTAYDRGGPVPPGSVAIVSRAVSVLVSPTDAGRRGALGRISSVTLEDDLLPLLDLWVEGYATREVDAYSELDAGARAVAIMGDLTMTDVVDTAVDGFVLPEKTTCFNPKVAVGLVGVGLPIRDPG